MNKIITIYVTMSLILILLYINYNLIYNNNQAITIVENVSYNEISNSNLNNTQNDNKSSDIFEKYTSDSPDGTQLNTTENLKFSSIKSVSNLNNEYLNINYTYSNISNNKNNNVDLNLNNNIFNYTKFKN